VPIALRRLVEVGIIVELVSWMKLGLIGRHAAD